MGQFCDCRWPSSFYNSLTIFISFLSDHFEHMLFQWRMSWFKWLCDWLNVVALTFKLIFPGENRLVEFLTIFHQIHPCSDIKLLVSIICDVTAGLFVIISPATIRVPFLSACLHDFRREDQPYFVQLLHSYYSQGTLHQSGTNIFHCCVIEWSKMSVTVKCLKMFLSSQRLIRRNPHLAFYFNWNPIFVISTNLLMVR